MEKTLFVEHNRLNEFELDVAKAFFMEKYDNVYTLHELHQNENSSSKGIKVVQDNRKELLIYLFNQPRKKELKKRNFNGEVLVFYKINKTKTKYKSEKLTNEFILEYEQILNAYTFNPSILSNLRYYKKFLEKYEDTDLFKQKDDKTYKYYTQDALNAASRKINEGFVTFSKPAMLNDPFDCDLSIDGKDVQNNLNVLCTTDMNKNLLMWSYYGDSHKGCCIEYSKHLVLQHLNQSYMGICLYGFIKYAKKRPKYALQKRNLENISKIKHQLSCLFTKYENWKHEKEFRFVIFGQEEDYFMMKTDCLSKLFGCRSAEIKKLQKHKTKYELI